MPRQPQDRTKINLHMQTRVLDGLKKIARVKGTTYSELIREACRLYVVAEGQKLLSEQKAMAAAHHVPKENPPRPLHPAFLGRNPGDPPDEEVLQYVDNHADRTIIDADDPRSRT
jgi:hypothetical protein